MQEAAEEGKLSAFSCTAPLPSCWGMGVLRGQEVPCGASSLTQSSPGPCCDGLICLLKCGHTTHSVSLNRWSLKPLKSPLYQGSKNTLYDLIMVDMCCCVCVGVCVWVLVARSRPTLCDPMDCSLPGSSVHGILQARILEWVAIPFFRGSSWPRDRTQVSCTAGRFFTAWATREDRLLLYICLNQQDGQGWAWPLRQPWTLGDDCCQHTSVSCKEGTCVAGCGSRGGCARVGAAGTGNPCTFLLIL